LEWIADLSDTLVKASRQAKIELLDAFNLKATYDCGTDTIWVSVGVTAPFAQEVEGEKTLWGLSGVGGGT